MIIREKAYARGALVGNPSDGYFGKTIALTVGNFEASVVLYESPELEIVPHTEDHSRFASIRHLADDVRQFGYYGGIRLLKAAVKRFYDYCTENGIRLPNRNFTVRYQSDIPRLVGLAGSSAIITAGFRGLMRFYEVRIPRPIQANLILSVEVDELGLSAGLQDRVIQVHEGVIYMDFDRDLMRKQGYGRYEPLNPQSLPPLYVAYREDLAEGSEIVHNDLRERYRRGDADVLAAVKFWAELTDRVRAAMEGGRQEEIGPLLNANFDRRAQVCKISEGNLKMVMAARSVGASAKFTGSGGAIIGTYQDDAMYGRLCEVLEPMRITVFKPILTPSRGEQDV